jgi:hypothetical protein
MALDPEHLRDELVMMIAAGRELSPEHDYALADVFLDNARESIRRAATPPAPPPRQGHIAALAGAALLAFAFLLSPFLLFHGHHGPGAFNQSVVPAPERQHQVAPPSWWNAP